MNTTWMVTIIATLLGIFSLVFFVGVAPVQAALPPLDEEDLNLDARYIVVGKVKTVSQTEVPIDIGTNLEYQAVIAVSRVEKGLLMSDDPDEVVDQPPGTPLPGEEITVHFWESGERPLGWTGPGGQYLPLLPYDETQYEVRLFLTVDDEGRLHLLEPNGWESIPEEE